MKITPYVAKIVRTLLDQDGKYQSAHEIAQAIGVPPQNLKTSMAKLVKANVVVTAGNSYPTLYTLNQPMALDLLKLIDQTDDALTRRIA